MTLLFTTAGIGGAARKLEKDTLSAKSRIQGSEWATVGKGGRKLFVLASWEIRRLGGFGVCKHTGVPSYSSSGKAAGSLSELPVGAEQQCLNKSHYGC